MVYNVHITTRKTEHAAANLCYQMSLEAIVLFVLFLLLVNSKVYDKYRRSIDESHFSKRSSSYMNVILSNCCSISN